MLSSVKKKQEIDSEHKEYQLRLQTWNRKTNKRKLKKKKKNKKKKKSKQNYIKLASLSVDSTAVELFNFSLFMPNGDVYATAISGWPVISRLLVLNEALTNVARKTNRDDKRILFLLRCWTHVETDSNEWDGLETCMCLCGCGCNVPVNSYSKLQQ